MIGSLLQLAGLGSLALAAFLVSIPLGLAAVGAALVLVGLALEPPKE